jgi:hypothetical protein
MTVPELLAHAELHASAWTDVMNALRRLSTAEAQLERSAARAASDQAPTPALPQAVRERPLRAVLADLEAPVSARTATVVATPRKTPAKLAAAKKPAPAPVDRAQRDLLDWAAREATVEKVLKAAKGPLATAEVAARTHLSDYAVKATLRRLVDTGRIQHSGATSTSRWSVVAAPAPVVSAPPAKTVKAAGQEFDVVFAGGPGLTSVGRS